MPSYHNPWRPQDSTHGGRGDEATTPYQNDIMFGLRAGLNDVAGSDLPSGLVTIGFHSDTNSYFVLEWASVVDGDYSDVGLELGAESQTFTTYSNEGSRAFFRMRGMDLDQPADADNDGIDDLYEDAHPPLNPFDASDAAANFDVDGSIDARGGGGGSCQSIGGGHYTYGGGGSGGEIRLVAPDIQVSGSLHATSSGRKVPVELAVDLRI